LSKSDESVFYRWLSR